jgi:hypothetical protein
VVHDLRAELVAHDDVAREIHDAGVAGAAPGLDEPLGVAEGVKVRAADAAGEGADEHLARPRLGRGDVGDHELPVPHDDGAHDEPPSRPRGRGALARGHGGEVGWDRVVHEPHAPDGALLGVVDIALVVGRQ